MSRDRQIAAVAIAGLVGIAIVLVAKTAKALMRVDRGDASETVADAQAKCEAAKQAVRETCKG